MSTLAFFRTFAPVTLGWLSREIGTTLPAGADPALQLCGIAPPGSAGHDELTAFHDGLPPDDLRATRAAACLVAPHHALLVPAETVALVAVDPGAVFRRLAARLDPAVARPASAYGNRGVDAAARVDGSALLEDGVVVDAGAIVGPGAEIGSGTYIGAHSVIGAGVRIGRDCAVDCQATIRHALIGDRVTIAAGARIGHGAGGVHIGRVIIQDDVAIGVNASVERGACHDTVIGDAAEVGAFGVVRGGVTIPRRTRLAAG